MGKSDSLKNGMRSGLDGLLSSTGKSTQKKEPAPVSYTHLHPMLADKLLATDMVACPAQIDETVQHRLVS